MLTTERYKKKKNTSKRNLSISAIALELQARLYAENQHSLLIVLRWTLAARMAQSNMYFKASTPKYGSGHSKAQ